MGFANYSVLVCTNNNECSSFLFEYWGHACLVYNLLTSEASGVEDVELRDIESGKCLLFWNKKERDAEAAKRFKLDYVREFSGFVRESVYFDDLDQATATLERAKEGDAAMAIRVTDQKKRKVKAEWLRDEKWGEVL